MAAIAALFAVLFGTARADSPEELVPQTWQMLDYLASDYRGAVRDGRVFNASEYAEMQEFAATARARILALPARPERAHLLERADHLIQDIAEKNSADRVGQDARGLADDLLSTYPVPSAPLVAPDIGRGMSLYAGHCAACHGASGRGDGPASIAVRPRPVDFTDREQADGRSLLSLYESISQGVPGTAMASFGALPDADRWALAFYVASIAYADESKAGATIWANDPASRERFPDFGILVRTRAADVLGSADGKRALDVLAYLRGHPESLQRRSGGLGLASARLMDSLEAYRSGRREDAARLALSAYLDGLEPLEPALDAREPRLREQLETAMGQYRASLDRGEDVATVVGQVAEMQKLLDRAEQSLAGAQASALTTFAGAFTILVREGLEALLVVVAMIAFLRKTERRGVTRYVHAGWLLALAAGIATWGIATHLIALSGSGREVTEGLSSLFASVVLLGVGIWMHRKSIGGRWQVYLQEKLAAALDRRSGFFLFGLAFIAVYREVFETILFYAALWSNGQGFWMLAGMASGGATLAIIAWALLRSSRRLPIGTFFAASSLLIAVLAFVLAGKGVAALQEAGWVGVSPVAAPRLDWLGMFPSWQSLGAQTSVLVIVVLAYLWNRSDVAAQTGG